MPVTRARRVARALPCDAASTARASRRGDRLGAVGTTGNAPADVPHLHFAIARTDTVARWWRGTPVDPHPLLAP